MTRSVRGPGLTGLVNGVLQSLRRAQPEHLALEAADSVSALASQGSHPAWLIERWLHQFGRQETTALLAANNQRPALYLRILDGTVERACARLAEAGIDAAPVQQIPGALQLISGDVVRALQLVPAVVQDPAAMLVVQFAAFSAGWIADLCAAPGGKALALSRTGDAFVVASDVSYARLQRVQQNRVRTGSHDVALVNADARQLPLASVPQVLLDAPCTGTGTLRRHPDGKWRLDPAALQSLIELQRQLLAEAAACTAAGGLLVYATCSLEVEENEQQVEHFLNTHSDFSLEPAAAVAPGYLDGAWLRVLPQRHGFDGAFAARLRKAA
jgi:16S rRNA (cytosine967-C5)-methyltransferase